MIPLADLIDSDLLPPLLQDFERIIGLAATLDLVRAYGGLRIYIPTPARVRPDHPIAKIIGVDALMARPRSTAPRTTFHCQRPSAPSSQCATHASPAPTKPTRPPASWRPSTT